MIRSKIAGVGKYLPSNIVTNDDLTMYMETSDQWIQERTGIQERRFADKHKETTTTMAAEAAKMAIDRAGIDKEAIDFIIFATLSPDYYFPGCGVLLQRELGITKTEIGALDIRNQCSGFLYALSVGDQFIKTGMYKNILIVGSEMHSMGTEFSTKGRNVLLGPPSINILNGVPLPSKVLIMDESTNALDAENEANIFNDISKIKENLIVLVISHDKELLKKFCDNIFVLKNKKLSKI